MQISITRIKIKIYGSYFQCINVGIPAFLWVSLDETEGEYAYQAQPYTFVLRPDLRIHAIYSGWYFVGRPTNEELRLNLRTIMESRSDYRYEAYDVAQK